MHTIRDAMIVFRDEVSASLRNRVGIAIGLVQPCVYLFLFGPLLTKALPSQGDNAWRMYIPGLLVQLALFTTAYAGFNLIPDMRSGYLERLRVTPASRLALLLGRVLRDLVLLTIQLLCILALGLAFGLRASLPGVLASAGYVLLLGISLASLSYMLALRLPLEYLFAPVLNGICLPLMLLSGILLPMTFAPGWLRGISDANPLRYAVDAMRDLFDGRFSTQPVAIGALVVMALAALSMRLSTRVFGQYNS
ncbi:transport permease protein [Kitasatospora phosalacinea]|uniref:Transport permease protein n=1 Tax=Kitasatospora phosalacinea TaxID=2065 RepID=A0A9W6V472_9ACTN|nr:ABC transporter permease [Kitasatospora phosalacinea]GLW74431.1 transport permease protein [Kitasatospora phosalacinea]